MPSSESVTLAALRGEREGLAYAAGLLDGETDKVSKRSRRLIETRLAATQHKIRLIERAAS